MGRETGGGLGKTWPLAQAPPCGSCVPSERFLLCALGSSFVSGAPSLGSGKLKQLSVGLAQAGMGAEKERHHLWAVF